MMEFIRNYAVEGKIDLAFSAANARKDIGYYRQMADDLGKHSRMSASTYALLSEVCESGDGNIMVPAIVDWFSDHLDSEPQK